MCALCVSVLLHSRTRALSHLADTALPTPVRRHTGSHWSTAPCVPRCTISAFCVVPPKGWCDVCVLGNGVHQGRVVVVVVGFACALRACTDAQPLAGETAWVSDVQPCSWSSCSPRRTIVIAIWDTAWSGGIMFGTQSVPGK